MSIQTFTREFQDYLFSKNPILYLLTASRNISHSDVFVAIKHAEELLEEFKDSPNFLEKETENLKEEIETIYSSLNKKVDKINSYSEAILNLNSTIEDRYSVKNVVPYDLSINQEGWNTTENCLTLPGVSTYLEIKPYRTLTERETKKFTYSFVLPTTMTFNGLTIIKTVLSDITSVEFLNVDKKTIELKHLGENEKKTTVNINSPIGCYIVIIETTSEMEDSDIKLVPSIFEFQNVREYPLEEREYSYTDMFTVQTSSIIPEGCYLQVNFQITFFDVNGIPLHFESYTIPVDNNGNCIGFTRDTDASKILYGFKDNTKIKYTEGMELKEDMFIMYTPSTSKNLSMSTENTIKFKVRNAKTFKCIPTVQMYSLLNSKLSPKLFTLTGITKNENNK